MEKTDYQLSGASIEKLNYTREEAERAACVSAPTFRQWTRTPGFPIIRVGKKILVPIEPFKEWLAEQARGGE